MDLARAERLSNLSLDYRVALAHSPIQPNQVTEAKAGWVDEKHVYGESVIRYGFVLAYRGRWVYLWGQRWSERERLDHSYQWFDEEPEWMYDTPHDWDFEIGEILNGPYFLSDEEADRPTGDDRDNSDPE